MLAKGLKVLVIGGGFSGMTAAIQLRKAGADVELVEIDPGWRTYGAGITLAGSGSSLRALREIGVLEEFLRRGHAADGLDLFTSGGHKIASIPTPRLAGRMCRPAAQSCVPSSPPFSPTPQELQGRRFGSEPRSPTLPEALTACLSLSQTVRA